MPSTLFDATEPEPAAGVMDTGGDIAAAASRRASSILTLFASSSAAACFLLLSSAATRSRLSNTFSSTSHADCCAAA